MRCLVALPIVALACACAEPPASVAAPRRATEMPRAPQGPVTRFDGVYAGPLTQLGDRTRACPPAPTAERSIEVRGGRATLLLDPRIRQTQTGTVGADGSVRMSDSLDRTIATSGVFSDTTFQGEYRNGLCAYSMVMRKRA